MSIEEIAMPFVVQPVILLGVTLVSCLIGDKDWIHLPPLRGPPMYFWFSSRYNTCGLIQGYLERDDIVADHWSFPDGKASLW